MKMRGRLEGIQSPELIITKYFETVRQRITMDMDDSTSSTALLGYKLQSWHSEAIQFIDEHETRLQARLSLMDKSKAFPEELFNECKLKLDSLSEKVPSSSFLDVCRDENDLEELEAKVDQELRRRESVALDHQSFIYVNKYQRDMMRFIHDEER